jgi:hypothetical protein
VRFSHQLAIQADAAEEENFCTTGAPVSATVGTSGKAAIAPLAACLGECAARLRGSCHQEIDASVYRVLGQPRGQSLLVTSTMVHPVPAPNQFWRD